jgi:hypothetical protein
MNQDRPFLLYVDKVEFRIGSGTSQTSVIFGYSFDLINAVFKEQTIRFR